MKYPDVVINFLWHRLNRAKMPWRDSFIELAAALTTHPIELRRLHRRRWFDCHYKTIRNWQWMIHFHKPFEHCSQHHAWVTKEHAALWMHSGILLTWLIHNYITKESLGWFEKIPDTKCRVCFFTVMHANLHSCTVLIQMMRCAVQTI